MIEALRRVWGKVRRAPRLPDHFPTASEPKPLYTVTVGLGSMIYTDRLDSVVAAPARPSWADYNKLMASHPIYDGWTFCKFGVRGPGREDHTDVLGIVRAPFGAWLAPFVIVEHGSDVRHRYTRGLACIEHTRTGMAIGVFGDMEVAVAAAEIAARMADWNAFDVEEAQSLYLIRRVRSAWDAAGIVQSLYAGYPTVNGKVPEGQGPVAIFVKNPMADQQRPEKLS